MASDKDYVSTTTYTQLLEAHDRLQDWRDRVLEARETAVEPVLQLRTLINDNNYGVARDLAIELLNYGHQSQPFAAELIKLLEHSKKAGKASRNLDLGFVHKTFDDHNAMDISVDDRDELVTRICGISRSHLQKIMANRNRALRQRYDTDEIIQSIADNPL